MDDKYIIYLKWFQRIKCDVHSRGYTNFIEFHILDDKDKVVDIIKLRYSEALDSCKRFYLIDKKRFDVLKKYIKINV